MQPAIKRFNFFPSRRTNLPKGCKELVEKIVSVSQSRSHLDLPQNNLAIKLRSELGEMWQ